MTVKELEFDTQQFIEAHTALVLQRNAHSLVIEQGRADISRAEAVGRIISRPILGGLHHMAGFDLR